MAGVAVALLAAALILLPLNARVMHGGETAAYAIVAVTVLIYAGVGTLLATRVPRNAIGWLLSVIGLSLATNAFLEQYGVRALVSAPGSLPAAKPLVAFTQVTGVLMLAPIILLVLLFPDGRLRSRRWRPVFWGALWVNVVGSFGQLLQRGVTIRGGLTNALDSGHAAYPNPFGIFPRNGWYGGLLGVTGLIAAVTSILAVVSVFVRRRGGSAELRQQLAWLGYVGLSFFVALLVMAGYGIATHGRDSALGTFLFGLAFTIVLLGIPLACTVAVLKYRLYELDIVVKRTVVFGVLVAVFTAIYAAIVLGVGAAIGGRGNSELTFGAAVAAAVALQPLRTRAQRFADRLVYGRRATPYEVLSEFSERMAGTYSTEDVLPRMARMLVEATGAQRAEVWLQLDGTLRREAAWPADDEGSAADRHDPAEVFEHDGRTRAFVVEHQGDRLGALRVTSSPREPLTPVGERLVRDVAAQAGLVLRNVRLIEDLRSSRQRIVAAADEARRRLERNLHDGAQQQLVSLRVKLGLVRRLVPTAPEKADEVLEQTERETQEALEDLRDLARGIYPPLLADAGLPAALSAQARKAVVPVTVDADGVGRYSQDVEAAVYFSVLEALQNVAKYANASTACVRLREEDGGLRFEVIDDGAGFDPLTTSMGTGVQGMADRLAALDGDVSVDSSPGRGTTVTGRVPVK